MVHCALVIGSVEKMVPQLAERLCKSHHLSFSEFEATAQLGSWNARAHACLWEHACLCLWEHVNDGKQSSFHLSDAEAIHQFWDRASIAIPVVPIVAKALLQVPPAEAACERSFSIQGWSHDKET